MINKHTKGLFEEAYKDIVAFCISRCSEKYGFDEEIARKFLLKHPSKKFILPFTGYIDENKCKGVKYTSGLHLQCSEPCQKLEKLPSVYK